MKKQIETKTDGNDFAKFKNFVREIVRVPKEEINKREKAEQEKKAKKRLKTDPSFSAFRT